VATRRRAKLVTTSCVISVRLAFWNAGKRAYAACVASIVCSSFLFVVVNTRLIVLLHLFFCELLISQVWLRTVSLPNQPSGQMAVALVNWRANTNSTTTTPSRDAAASSSDGQAVTASWDLLGLAPGTTVAVRD